MIWRTKYSGWELCDREVVLSSGVHMFKLVPVEELRPRRTPWRWLCDCCSGGDVVATKLRLTYKKV